MPSPDFVSFIGIPGAGFLDQLMLHPKLDDFSFARNTLAIEDIEFPLLECGATLFLTTFDAGFAADHLIAFLDGAGPAYIQRTDA